MAPERNILIALFARLSCQVGRALVLLVFFGSASGNASDNTYIFIFADAQRFESVYHKATLRLELGGPEINGELQLIEKKSIQVSGSSEGLDRMRLTFKLEHPATYEFVKTIDKDIVRWTAQTDGEEVNFSRNLRAAPSDAALELSASRCGVPYGWISVSLRPGTTAAQLRTAVQSDPVLTQIAAHYRPRGHSAKERHVSLAVALMKLYNDGSLGDRDRNSIGIEIGTELAAVRKLRSLEIVSYADFPLGICGGADRAYFIAGRDAFFQAGVFSQLKFKQYIEAGLKGFLTQEINNRTFNFRMGAPVIRAIRVPPFTTDIRYLVVGASEVTRREPRYWDRFFVSFEPVSTVDNTADDSSVVVTVESLSVSRQSMGSSVAPGDEQFTMREDRFEDEAIITAGIENFFATAQHGVSCTFEIEGFDIPQNKPSC